MIKKIALLSVVLIVISVIGLIFTWTNLKDLSSLGVKESAHTEVTHQITFEQGALTRMKLNHDTVDVKVVVLPSTNGSNVLDIRGHVTTALAERMQQLRITNQTFEMNLDQQPAVDGFEFQLFNLKFKQPSITITLYLTQPTVFDLVEIQSSSANVEVRNLTANDIVIDQEFGDLTLDRIQAKSTILKVGFGYVEGSSIRGTLLARVEVGDVEFDNVDGDVDVTVQIGDIDITQTKVNQLNIKTHVGDVYIDHAPDFTGFYDIQTRVGDIQTKEALQQTTDVIQVRVDVGDITIE